MPTSRVRLAVGGAVAAASGIVVSQVVTNVFDARATPVQAVAEVVIAKTPGSVVEKLIQIVGRNDKTFLVAGITIAIVILGAVAGLLSGRRLWPGMLLFAAMAVVALLAASSRPEFGAAALLALVLGAGAWFISLSLLVTAAVTSEGTSARAGAGAGKGTGEGTSAGTTSTDARRTFLKMTGGVVVGTVAIAVVGRVLGGGRRAVAATRSKLRLPIRAGTVPPGAQIDLPGITPWRVADDVFYRIDTALIVPAVDPNSWRLRIHGMVDHEITLTYQDLLNRQLTQDWVTICCVSNPVGGPLIGNAYWSGVRIAPILAQAGVQSGANALLQTSHDNWTCGTPISAVTDGRNAMLAIGMNGQPLPLEHGFPVRMIVPGLYGFVSACKWVVDLEVTTYDRFSAYWTERGWSVKGPIKTESRIEVPRGFSKVKAGALRVGGHAWAQHTGIEKVEFRLDGRPWQRAELGRVPSDDTWVQWVGSIEVPAGSHSLAVRATDKSGYTQTAVRRDVVPNGASGWHTIQFTAT